MLKTYILNVSALEDPILFEQLYNMIPASRKAKVDKFRFEADKRLSLGASALFAYAVSKAIDEGIADDMSEEAESGNHAIIQTNAEEVKSYLNNIYSGYKRKDMKYIDTLGTQSYGDNKTANEAYLNFEQNLELEYGPKGKPFLKNHKNIFFNLSHSGDYALCVVSDREVGCDIQRMDELKMKVAKRFFAESEYKLLEGLEDDEAKRRLFYRIWVLKESFIKMTGLGLSQEMSTFSFIFDDEEVLIDQEISNEKYKFYEAEQGYDYKIAVCYLS